MKFYTIHPIIAALFFGALLVIVAGLFIILPIAFIQWVWNFLIANVVTAPHISGWQASLLYMAFATIVYLSGLVRIEIHADEH